VPDASRKNRNRRRLLTLLAAAAGVYAWLIWFERRNVFQPASTLDASGEEIGFPKEDVWLTTSDRVRLHAWYYPGRAGTNGLAFLLCHGNGGNIGHRLDQYYALLRLGVAVLAFDYRGYGHSAGSAGESGVYRDAEAAHDWLVARGYPAGGIIAHGESLGGGVATELALRRTVGGLVLQSSFTSVPDLGSEIFPWLPVRTVGRIKFATHEKLPRVQVPVLVLHSRTDTIVPFHHGERNFAAAREPKFLRELQGDHNDGLAVDREAFSQAMGEFIGVVTTRSARRAGNQEAGMAGQRP
jgi:fermentation-respiration switch protein FrsA (DUF1100 family)